MILSVGIWLALSWYHENLLLEARRNAVSVESALGTATTSAANRRLALLQGLRAFVLTDLDLERMDEEFDTYAAILYSSVNGIRNFTIAPGGTHQFVYPLPGNEGVLGHDLLTDERPNVRDDVARAIVTGEVTLSGPYELRQGGLGLVARQGISSNGQFWGFVTMVIDIEPILIEAGLDLLQSQMTFALVHSSGNFIAGDEAAVVSGSAGSKIVLPDGSWLLYIAPVDGWNAAIMNRFLATLIPSVFGGCLLLLLLYTFARRQVSLSRMARRDPLTGALNRYALEELLEHEASRSERYTHSIGFLMIDVNRFKEVNDRFGHAMGDKVLQVIATVIQDNIRDPDILVRYGGDEFLVILLETTGETELVKDRIQADVARRNETNSLLEFPVTVAIGSGYWNSGSGQSLEDVLAEADKLMYEDKMK